MTASLFAGYARWSLVAIVLGIVQSYPFLNRRTADTEDIESPAP